MQWYPAILHDPVPVFYVSTMQFAGFSFRILNQIYFRYFPLGLPPL